MIKIKKILYKFFKSDYAKIIISFVLIVTFLTIVNLCSIKKIKWTEFFEVKTALSLSLTGLVAFLIVIITKQLSKSLEEKIKISDNYAKIILQYKSHSSKTTNEKFLSVKTSDKKHPLVPIPTICLVNNKDKNVSIKISDNNKKQFIPDELINPYYSYLLNAHKYSISNNSDQIRIDSYSFTNNVLTLNTSRTTFYNSLVTNRAIDYPLPNGGTIRSLYEYNSKITPLEESKLSNHFGINVHLTTSDGYDIIAFRKQYTNISNKAYAPAVSGKFYFKRINDQNSDEVFSLDMYINAIKNMIKNQYEITEFDFSIENNFLGFTRSLMEGGKPDLFFHVTINETKQELLDKDKSRLKYKKPKSKKQEKNDYNRMLDDLNGIKSTNNTSNTYKHFLKKNNVAFIKPEDLVINKNFKTKIKGLTHFKYQVSLPLLTCYSLIQLNH